ncbi:MAG: hypothetical protein JWR43_2816 [Phenylobacterium sp.]|jgi:hypothetical protein|nr:hypothetical protein [Phenylobacterium sp.]
MAQIVERETVAIKIGDTYKMFEIQDLIKTVSDAKGESMISIGGAMSCINNLENDDREALLLTLPHSDTRVDLIFGKET